MVVPTMKAKVLTLAEHSSKAFRSLKSLPKEAAAAYGEVEVVKVSDEVFEAIEEVVAAPAAPEEVVEVEDFLDINDLKVSELKKILDSNGVEYTATKKADLIELVKAVN